MKYPWVDEYLLAKRAVEKDFQQDWNWIRYKIDGKMFAAICLEGEKARFITLKLPPEEGELLRKQYPDVLPGYYMNHLHWNSVCACGEVPQEVLRTMLDHAYLTVMHGLSKRRQRELLAQDEKEDA